MNSRLKINPKIIPFYLFFIAISIYSFNKSFFWDTIQLASKHAHWYYENDFRYFLLPDAFDSGHPPYFGMFLALAWKVFGKTLVVSHLVILPFLIGMVYQTFKITGYFFSPKWRYFAMAILLIDPTVLSQSLLVSPDIPVYFFFLLSVNSLVHDRKYWLAVSVLFLSALSLRGMMITFVVALVYLIIEYRKANKTGPAIINTLIVFLPAGIVAGTFLLVHYMVKGWIGYHQDSPWAPSFEKVDAAGFIRNMAIYAWRLLDFGRVVIWAVLFILMAQLKKIKQKIPFSLALAALLFLLVFPLSMIMHRYLLAHRYLMPVNFFVALSVLYLLFHSSLSDIKKRGAAILIAGGLVAGNFLVYPDKVATGWDSTLAHIPYYSLRKQMISYIHSQNIPINQVGSAFPNTVPFKYTDLSEDESSFSEKDTEHQKYIFYSNVFNDFTDDETHDLKKNWVVQKEFRCLTVKVQLYRNPQK